MKTSLLMLMLLAVILLGTLLTTEPPALGPERSAAAAAAVVPGSSDTIPARGNADLQEIRAVVDSARTAEAQLLADLGEAASPEHPAVRRHRLETAVRLLEIQARQAADRGQHGLERRIRANLADLRAEGSFAPVAEPRLARQVR